MTNQKARAMVQQDYYLQRQGVSQQHLAKNDDSNTWIGGTVLSNDMQNNPTFSYEAFLNQPTTIKSNMKLGVASKGKNSLVGRGVASPFGVAKNIIAGSNNPSNK